MPAAPQPAAVAPSSRYESPSPYTPDYGVSDEPLGSPQQNYSYASYSVPSPQPEQPTRQRPEPSWTDSPMPGSCPEFSSDQKKWMTGFLFVGFLFQIISAAVFKAGAAQNSAITSIVFMSMFILNLFFFVAMELSLPIHLMTFLLVLSGILTIASAFSGVAANAALGVITFIAYIAVGSIWVYHFYPSCR